MFMPKGSCCSRLSSAGPAVLPFPSLQYPPAGFSGLGHQLDLVIAVGREPTCSSVDVPSSIQVMAPLTVCGTRAQSLCGMCPVAGVFCPVS